MALKTRKQIRKDLETVNAELELLKSPEGLARYMISKGGDEDFEDRFQAEIHKIGDEQSEPSELVAPPVEDAFDEGQAPNDSRVDGQFVSQVEHREA